MAISGALVVSSFAKDSSSEALPSQAAAASNEIIFTNDMSTNNNGDVAGPPTDGTPSYVGRLVIVRKGLSTEETAYITAESGAGPVTCTCHQDWTIQPSAGDTYHIFYVTTDMDLGGGNNFKELLKRVSDWAAADPITIANGGGFALLDGHSIETVDNSSTTAADVVVQSGGLLQIGYLAGETPVGGGYIAGTPAIDGELVLDIQSGGKANLYDFFLTCVKTNKVLMNGEVNWVNAKMFAAGYQMDLTGDVSILRNSKISGRGTSSEYCICDATTDIDSLIISNCYGLRSPDDSVTETIEIANAEFVNMQLLLTVFANKTWKIINPIWSVDETTQNDIDFQSATGSSVEWHYSLDVLAAEADGTVVVGASVNIYEGLLNQNLTGGGSPLQTDSNGKIATTILEKIYTDGTTNLSVVDYGNYVLRVFKHGYMPSISAITEKPLEVQSTMLTDAAISETVAATAITNGPSADPVRDAANPHTLLFFDTGANTLNVGETITANGGATGVVVEISEGDSASGKVFLKTRNGTAFVQNETLSSSGSWTGAVIDNATFEQKFTWHIEGQSKSFQALYDWQSAELANTTLNATWQSVHIWAAGNLGYMLHVGTSGYYTERSQGEGVFISGRGAGTLAYLTADDGSVWLPPSTVSLSVTDLPDGVEVRIKQGSYTIDHVQNVTGGTYTYIYSYSGSDTPVTITAGGSGYVRRYASATLKSTDQSISLELEPDPSYV